MRASTALVVLFAALASAQPRSLKQICESNCAQQYINCTAPRVGAVVHLQDQCTAQNSRCLAACPPEAPPAGSTQAPATPSPIGANPYNPQPAFVPMFSNNMAPVPPKVDLSDETFEQWAQAEKDRQQWNWKLAENQRMIVEMAAAVNGRTKLLEALARASGFPIKPGSPVEVPPLKPLPFRKWKGRVKPSWTSASGSVAGTPDFSVEQVVSPQAKPLAPDHFDTVPSRTCGPFKVSMQLDGPATVDRERVSLSFSQPVDGWNRVVFTLVLTALDGERAEVTVNAYATHAGGPWQLTAASPFATPVGRPNRRITGWEIKAAKVIDINAAMTTLQQTPASPFGVKGTEYLDTTARTPLLLCNQIGFFN